MYFLPEQACVLQLIISVVAPQQFSPAHDLDLDDVPLPHEWEHQLQSLQAVQFPSSAEKLADPVQKQFLPTTAILFHLRTFLVILS